MDVSLLLPRILHENRVEEIVRSVFASADVQIDGNRPWDIQVRDPRFYQRILGGSLAFGESYMDEWWDCQELDECVCRLLRAKLNERVQADMGALWHAARARLLNIRSREWDVNKRHYDLGNDLYERMLDRRMVYSCGYWKDARTLDEAQEAKLDVVCRKIGLKRGQRILDIGCGFGGFARFAAERYGAEAVGVTLSEEQAAYAGESCKGLPVEIRLQDYRDIPEGERYDHIVSIGMFEHVGLKNYQTFMRVVHGHLRDNGLFLLHTIGGMPSWLYDDPWIAKYIFPHGHVPGIQELVSASAGSFVMEDWHGFGPDYDRTLLCWNANVESRWDEIPRYDGRFRRMWRYYLLSCAGAFRSRDLQLWQIVFSKEGIPGGYVSVR